MLSNMKSNNKVGKAITETASIAYDGTLLPTGTASYAGISIDATKRYLKNSGKDKTPALVESGQGKFFNGTSQYINTGIIPNQAQGTLVARFTYVTGQVSRCIIGTVSLSIWVNASGKIEGQFGDVLVASTDVLVNGLSYHVSLSWVGLVATIKVNYVTKAMNTATIFAPTNAIYIGARNNVGTADRYFNNVIDETYYYNVALPDTAIQSLYLYPEKVKSYNGAIVPDIGYEANCKLFLPLCENSGSNVVNVAVARSAEITTNGDFSNGATGWVPQAISAGVIYSEVVGGQGHIVSDGTLVSLNQSTTLTSGKYYHATITVTSLTGSMAIQIGADQLVISAVGTFQMIGLSTGNAFITKRNAACNAYFDNVSVKEITAYPLASYTIAMHTSAAKLSYGAQCTAWKRDSLGVLLGMSNGLSFDGGVSVFGVSTGWTPTSSTTFVVEGIVKRKDAIASQLYGCSDVATGRLAIGLSSTLNAQTNIGDKFPVTTIATDYVHLVIVYNGTIGSSKIYINGVENTVYVKETAFAPATPFYIGSLGTVQKTLFTTTPKIHKGAQYAKFNIAKAWAKAQKIITKLGA